MRLDRVDSTTVVNPILWEKGIRTMLGVPLLVAGEVIGVLHVGRLEDHPFNDADVELLQVVAERLAGAVQARQLAVERQRPPTWSAACFPVGCQSARVWSSPPATSPPKS